MSNKIKAIIGIAVLLILFVLVYFTGNAKLFSSVIMGVAAGAFVFSVVKSVKKTKK